VPAALTASSAPLGVYNNTVTGNQASQNGLKGEGAGVGIFASAPGCKAYGNLVANNTITGNGIPGVSIHGHAPGQVLDGNTIVGNTLSGNGADVADTATPGTAGIALTSVSPVSGTVINGNTISGEMIAVAWHAPGTAQVQRNSFSTYYGVYNLSAAGVVNADANWWGCNNNPAGGFAFLSGCAAIAGPVNVTSWLSAAPGK
jgi:Right handed beta helix region